MIRPLMGAGFASFLILGCSTDFHGDAHFPGGPQGCAAHCAQDHMVMASFVYVGEYSDACVCQPRASGGASEGDGSGAASAAVVAVVTQIRAAQAAQAAAAHH